MVNPDEMYVSAILKRIWQFLRKPSAHYSLLALVSVGFVAGIIFWGGFNTALEATNRLEFCIGCHEMRDNVYQEYKKTIHYQNPVGVRAICSDCHVPHAWVPKMWRKMQASMEVWAKITGKVDTREKFVDHRLEMAKHEWARMEANKSQECRNCHSFAAMTTSTQTPDAAAHHLQAMKTNEACIDCHKGIAHMLPKGYVDPAQSED